MEYVVEVWFATSVTYRPVYRTEDFQLALREARAYFSDSRGIRVVDSNGVITVVK